MRRRIGAKGQVVIPKELREQLGLNPGVEVDLVAEGDRIVLRPRRSPVLAEDLTGIFAGSGMAEQLVEDRLREPR